MTSVQGRGCPQRERFSEAPSGTSLPGSDDEDSLRLHERILEDPAGSAALEVPVKTSAAKYTEENLQRII